MAENTKIEWADHTFNPWMGCTKVSPACDNCYAENLMDTRYGRVRWVGDHGQPAHHQGPDRHQRGFSGATQVAKHYDSSRG